MSKVADVIAVLIIVVIASTCEGASLRRGTKSLTSFGHRTLCNTSNSQNAFRMIMKLSTCNLSDTFLEEFVKDICENNNGLLSLWISELFDTDGNGRISYFEEDFVHQLKKH